MFDSTASKPIHLQIVNWIFVLTILANLSGLCCFVFLEDSANYASIAKQMAVSHNYQDLFFQGNEWLDKPHFQFWLSALSFKVFGINTFAYKFPAILLTFLGAFYTYRLAKDLYNQAIARISVLVLLTALHLVVSNNDIRAEAYLIGLIMGCMYHFYRLKNQFSWKHLLLGAFFGACALMTKGIFALIPIAAALGGEMLLKGEWKQLLQWRCLLAIFFLFLFTIPELYALYEQFDKHPEKIIFGKTGVSGIRFFFWDSQFGRFFNTGPIKGAGEPTFFLHTLLWAFLPWSLVFYVAFFKTIREIVKKNTKKEFYTLTASLVTLL
ncbi:MAG: glycosyltransferase family 39 protein, partial [Verrucomicrobia bacterium]|nr:glycosyltransferase family 39 protein [Cytophagales bacterium]